MRAPEAKGPQPSHRADGPAVPASSGRERALFLDRDGVINEEIGYLYRAEEVRFVPGIVDLLRAARALHYVTVVVTNQSGIARGLYTEADFEALMAWMRERLERESVSLDAVYHCPFHPEHGVGEFRCEHPDRKPSPGMLLRAAREHGLDLAQSVLIGDRCSDVAAGNAAGLRDSMLLVDGPGSPGSEGCDGRYTIVRTLHEAEKRLRQLG